MSTQQIPPIARNLIRLGLLLMAVGGAAGGVAILVFVTPSEDSLYPRCQLHSLTGLHCPGCGTTRALHAFLNGHIQQAFAYNAIAFIVLPVLAWLLADSLWSWHRQHSIDKSSRLTGILIKSLIVLLILYGILRNLPFEPFSNLAPHEL